MHDGWALYVYYMKYINMWCGHCQIYHAKHRNNCTQLRIATWTNWDFSLVWWRNALGKQLKIIIFCLDYNVNWHLNSMAKMYSLVRISSHRLKSIVHINVYYMAHLECYFCINGELSVATRFFSSRISQMQTISIILLDVVRIINESFDGGILARNEMERAQSF